MAPALDHTIVACRNKERSARYLADVFGLGDPQRSGRFLAVQLENGVTLDYSEDGDETSTIATQHYAFVVGEEEFDEIFGRIVERGQAYWADPGLRRSSQVATRGNGRGVYFKDPDGHLLEILTRSPGGS